MSKPVTPHTLINILDGGTRQFADDGVSPGNKEGPVASVRRSQMLSLADKVVEKGPLKGLRIWWAEKPIKPAYNGDPLAQIPVMGPKEEKILEANVAKRQADADAEQKRVAPEVAQVVRQFAEAAMRGAPPAAPAPKGGAA